MNHRPLVCASFHRAVELIDRRWSGAIIFLLLKSTARFADLRAGIPGITDRMLSERLHELEGEGIVSRTVIPDTPVRVEYALTKDANTPAASQGVAKIAVQLSDNTLLTITRTGVDVKPRMAIWHGTVDGTDAPVTIMWWPDGRMTGTVQHAARLYSIRHLGGKLHAVVEMGEDRMPPEHAPMSPAKRAQHAHLADDPLVTQGDSSSLRP
ncbi:MAG: helix-turn-helix transcriptional regulator, partial [Phycisphaerae bacterium]|nr:helix-turn-helix transcriptional regulator [Gemmatimonadaceae bacterium]